MTPRILFASPLILITQPLHAQTAEGEAPVPVASEPSDGPQAPIVVTGRGLPQTPATPAYGSVTISRERIAANPSGRLEDVLGDVAGFQQFRRSDSRSSNPSAQGVTLRSLGGNATSRALVTLDGVPIADPFFGYIPLSAIPPETLGAIEVTRGGGSGPFGAGALSGTIALQSAAPGQLDTLSASLMVNDRGATQTRVIGSAAVGQGQVTAYGQWDRGDGIFTAPQDQRAAASVRAAFDSWTTGLRIVAPLADNIELQARGMVFEDRRTLRFDGANSLSEGQDASVRIVGRGAWQFDLVGYVQARNFANVVISSTRFTKVLDQRKTPSTGLGGKLEIRPPLGSDQTLRLGADFRKASGELQEEAFSAFSGALRERRRAGGQTSDLGLFAEYDRSFGALKLTGGLRADRTAIANGRFLVRDAAGALIREDRPADRSGWSTSYRAGALFDAGAGLRLRASAYSGLRLPTLNELYRPFVIFPVVTQANAALDNERLEGWEAGFDWRPAAGLTVAATYFDNRVEGAIANVTLTPTLRERQNLPAIDAQGVELSAGYSHGPWRAKMSLSHVDASVRGSGASVALDGNRPPQTPRWAAAGSFGWHGRNGATLSATLRHVGAQFESDQETDRLPAATTVGAYAELPVASGLSIMARAENLMNETIVTRNAGGILDLGVPRTIWGGVRLRY